MTYSVFMKSHFPFKRKKEYVFMFFKSIDTSQMHGKGKNVGDPSGNVYLCQ